MKLKALRRAYNLCRLIRGLFRGPSGYDSEGPQTGWLRIRGVWMPVCHGKWSEVEYLLARLNGPGPRSLVSTLILPAGERPVTDLPPDPLGITEDSPSPEYPSGQAVG